jgi:hypothetical protein
MVLGSGFETLKKPMARGTVLDVDVHYQQSDGIPTDSFVNDEGYHDGEQNPYDDD